jgi:hypothetical protein
VIERYGGLWLDRSASAPPMVKEEYDPALDVVKSIYRRRSDGFFEVAFWVKGKAVSDPQWSLPLWGSIAGPGIYGSIEDAVAHLNAIEAQYVEKRAARAK